MQATALVEACVQGHSSCVKALLEAGAKPHSKWQDLSPIQWASKQGNGACVDECHRGGGRLRPLPIGTRSASHEENCLLPPPLRDARPRRRQQSVHASDMDRAARVLGRPGAARSGSAPACSRPSRGGVSTPIAARSSSSAIRAWWGWEAPFVPTSGQSTGRGRGPGCPSAQSRRSRYAAGCDFDARARVVLTSTAECALLGMYHTHARALLPAHVDCVAAAPPRPAQAPPHPHPHAPVWPARINSEL